MTYRRWRASTAASAGLLGALAVAGCGSSGTSTSAAPSTLKSAPTALHAVEAAYTTTIDTKTAKFALTENVDAKSSSGSKVSQTVTASGAGDFATNAFEVTVNASSGGSVEVLETGGVAYVQIPPASRASVPGNKPWVSVNLNQVDQATLGRSFSQLASASNDSPTQVLSNLKAVSNNVTRIATPVLSGKQTTEYAATIDLNKVAAETKARSGAKAAKAVTAEEQALGTHLVPVKLWVGANNLLRQVEEQVPIPAASAGATNGSGSATLTITFSSYGSPVNLNPPPSSQVANITAQVIQQQNNSSGSTTTTTTLPRAGNG